jgi:hypothetical protein
MGLAPLMLLATTLLITRNQRILEHPATRKRPPRRQRPAPENPQTAPQDPRRRTALTTNRPDHEPCARRNRHHSRHQAKACPSTPQTAAPRPAAGPENRHHATGRQQAKMSQANVKIGPTET